MFSFANFSELTLEVSILSSQDYLQVPLSPVLNNQPQFGYPNGETGW